MRHGVDGVGEQIDEHLLDLHAVEGQQGQRGTALEALDLRHLGDDMLAELLVHLDEGGEPVVANCDEQNDPEAKADATHA